MKFSYSLVVCCYNSEAVIVPTIKALCRLELDESDDVELVVVDNNCNDRTVELVYESWESDSIDLSVVPETKPGLMNARRKGVAEASRDIVVFIDDDNILDSKWLKNLDLIYSRYENVACIGGVVNQVADNDYPWWFESYKAVYACGKQAEKSMLVSNTRMTLFGAGLAFRRSVIANIFAAGTNLFLTGRTKNRLLRGDDSELCMRCLLMGHDVYYSADLLLTHNILPARVSWDYVKRARFGGGMAEIVLSMYRAINSGREPKSYFEQVMFVVRQYLKFLSRPKKLFYIQKEGAGESFELQYLLGLTYGLLYFSPWHYRNIRNELLRLSLSK